MDALSALEHSTDFAVANRSTLERLAAQMVPRDYPAGTVLLSEGEPPRAVLPGAVGVGAPHLGQAGQALPAAGEDRPG
jgi:hypothetical protein